MKSHHFSLISVLSLACVGETGIQFKDDEVLGGVLQTWSCSNATCDKVFRIDGEALESCYYYDPDSGDTGTAGWTANTPVEIIANCTPGVTCDVTVGEDIELGVEGDILHEGEESGCALCLPFDTPSEDINSCCIFPPDGSYLNEWNDAGASLAATLLADCGIVVEELPAQCPTPEPLGYLNGDSCNVPFAPVAGPNADFYLTVDPADSYLIVVSGSYSEQVAVEGAGSAKSGPGRFMFAAIWADDGVLGGVDYENWVFTFRSPLEFSRTSGNLVVPEDGDVEFFGEGKIDSDEYVLTTSMTHNATGTMNSSTWMWSLDYTDTHSSGSMALHLEGPFEAAP